MVERKDPRCIAVVGGNEADVRRFIESDFKIRSGLCPNGHGLMVEEQAVEQFPKVQRCTTCGYVTNVLAEKGTAS